MSFYGIIEGRNANGRSVLITPAPVLTTGKGKFQMASSSIPHSSGIYKITCTANGRFYIGSSRNLARRWITHRRDLRGHYHSNPHLQYAFDKHGEAAFVFEVVEVVDDECLLEREQYWLDLLQPFAPVGFNIGIKADSGMRGRKASAETRAKLSMVRKGRKNTPEHNASISAGRRGVQYSAETRAKIGAASKGRKRSPESNERIREAHSKEFIVTSPSGEEFRIKGLARFCRENGLDEPTMSNVAQGKRSQHKGWKCRYAEGES